MPIPDIKGYYALDAQTVRARAKMLPHDREKKQENNATKNATTRCICAQASTTKIWRF